MTAKREYRQVEWTDETVRRFWEWQSQYPEQYFTYIAGDHVARALSQRFPRDGEVLDYGCGVGYLIPHLAESGRRVTGADLSPESVRVANERLKGTANFVGAVTVEALRERGDRFDAVVCVEVIEHLYDPQLDAALADMRRFVRPDGVVILTTPNDEDLSKSFVYCPESDAVYHRYQHVRSWTRATLAAYVRERGFEVVETFTTDFGLTLKDYPGRYLRRQAQLLLGRDPGDPNLVCVCRPTRG